MVSCEVEVLGDILTTQAAMNISTTSRMRRSPVDDEALAQAIGHSYHMPASHILAVDCRSVNGPRAGVARGHIGFWPQAVASFVGHDAFAVWMARTMLLIADALASLPEPGDGVPDELWIVFYCRKGKHRSCAATLIIGHLLEATTPHPPLSADMHVSAALLWPRMCNACAECVGPSQTRDQALELARRLWRQACKRTPPPGSRLDGNAAPGDPNSDKRRARAHPSVQYEVEKPRWEVGACRVQYAGCVQLIPCAFFLPP